MANKKIRPKTLVAARGFSQGYLLHSSMHLKNNVNKINMLSTLGYVGSPRPPAVGTPFPTLSI